MNYTTQMALINSKFEDAIVIHTVSEDARMDALANYIELNIATWVGKPTIWDLSNINIDRITADELQAFPSQTKTHTAIRKGEKSAIYVKKIVLPRRFHYC